MTEAAIFSHTPITEFMRMRIMQFFDLMRAMGEVHEQMHRKE